MKLLALMLIPVMLFAGCGKRKPLPDPYSGSVSSLIFGTFYGECAGNCVNIYRLDRGILRKYDSAGYPSLSTNFTFTSIRTMNDVAYSAAYKLLYQIPSELRSGSYITYGAPDSHDQGGMYIEVSLGATKHRFMIDLDDTPDQPAGIIAFKRKVADVMKQLR